MCPTLAESWIPLLREALERDGVYRLPLRGTSMLPTLPRECTIEVRPLPARVANGALIVFAAGDTLVAHRLVRQDRQGWIAQGDGRLGSDRPLAPSQILGIVTRAFDGDRTVWPHSSERTRALAWVIRHHLLRPPRWLWRHLMVLRVHRAPAP